MALMHRLWTRTLKKLGLKASKPAHQRPRRSLIESLEKRELLSITASGFTADGENLLLGYFWSIPRLPSR